MRILLTITSMGAGGAEQVLTLLVNGLASNGHEVAVLAPRGVRDAEIADVPHRRLLFGEHHRSAASVVRGTYELAANVRAFAPDVVNAQNVRLSGLSGIATRLPYRHPRPPVLATFHGVLPAEYRRTARVLRLADHVACVSADLRDALLQAGYPAARTSVVHNAVTPAQGCSPERLAELDEELGLAGSPVVAIVARLVPQKAHHRFVRAAATAARRVPAARFLVVGEGPLLQETEAAAQATGLGDRFVFTGVRQDARDLCARADVVVFSSDWEGLSIAALEAMAAGTPVLATDVQGMRELLATGAGETVPIDSGEALGQRLADLLLDPARRAAMGAAGKAAIRDRYSVMAMTSAYEALYSRLISRARA